MLVVIIMILHIIQQLATGPSMPLNVAKSGEIQLYIVAPSEISHCNYMNICICTFCFCPNWLVKLIFKLIKIIIELQKSFARQQRQNAGMRTSSMQTITVGIK